jgi:bacteriocin-like protein
MGANTDNLQHRKDQLKKNPVMSNDELNEISGGLGDEAAKEFGGKLSKAFD